MRPSRHFVYVVLVSLALISGTRPLAAQAPTITSLTTSPARPSGTAMIGDSLTITGTNFGASQAATSKLEIGSVSVTVSAANWADTSITATIPDVKAGSVDVVVTATVGSAKHQLTVSSPASIPITVTSPVIPPPNGKSATMNISVDESNCDDKNGTDLTQGISGPYTLSFTGAGLSFSSQTAFKCYIVAALKVDPNAAGPYKVILNDKAGNPVGAAGVSVLDSSAGPIPPGLEPQVDVFWEVMSQRNCSDVFGKRVAQRLYCIQLKIGNNSGHSIQIAGIGFSSKLADLVALGGRQVTIANSSYASTRAVLVQSQVWSNRNLFGNGLQGLGLVMGGFVPFYSGSHSPNSKLHFTTWTAIVSGVALQAYNLILPDPIVTQLKSLDDQSFRDSMIIPNNTHTQTVVFVEKAAVTLGLRDLNAKISDPSNGVPAELKSSSTETITNSTSPRGFSKGKSDPLLVKLALGDVVIVGDEIEYLQRVQVQSGAAASSTSSPVSASPLALSFPDQNGVTSGAAQTITLTNNGTANLSNMTSKITGTGAGDFTIQPGAPNACSAALAAVNSCTLSVIYNPLTSETADSRSATIDVSFSPGPSPPAIPLTGTASKTVYLSTTALDLGTATHASPSSKTLTITNLRTTSLGGLTFPVTGAVEFQSSANTCAGGTLAPASSCTVTVTFTPAVPPPPVGARTATLTVTSAGQPLQAVSLTGTGQ